jgi:predicted dehydrogenase
MKILIVGLGSIGKKHIDAIYHLYPNASIYALRSGNSVDTYRNVFNLHDITDFYFIPDFIIISNITILHENTILQMISYNCPLFIEKPVLCDLKNADLIVKKIKSHKITTYVACNMRFHPCIEFLKEYVKSTSSRINEVNIYCGSYLPSWRENSDFRNIYSANEEMGGGVHLDLIHELDYTAWIFGFPASKTRILTRNSSLQINSIDSARYILEYLDFTVGITLNYFRVDPKRYIEILFNEETLYVDLLTSTIYSSNNNEILFKNSINMSDIYIKQMKYFIECLTLKNQPMNDFETAIEVLKIAL